MVRLWIMVEVSRSVLAGKGCINKTSRIDQSQILGWHVKKLIGGKGMILLPIPGSIQDLHQESQISYLDFHLQMQIPFFPDMLQEIPGEFPDSLPRIPGHSEDFRQQRQGLIPDFLLPMPALDSLPMTPATSLAFPASPTQDKEILQAKAIPNPCRCTVPRALLPIL